MATIPSENPGAAGIPSGAEAPEILATGTAGAAGETGTAGAAGGDELLQRVVQGAHETIDRLAERAAPHVQRLHSGVSGANESLHAKADEWRGKGDELTESLRDTVREHPLAAVATALAVGMLIARLSR